MSQSTEQKPRERISAKDAAESLGLSRTTFQRRITQWGLKPCEPLNPHLQRHKVMEFWKDEFEAKVKASGGTA